MPFRSFKLSGRSKRDYNTELRYDIASCKVDGVQLVGLFIDKEDNDAENSRLCGCVVKILSSMKKNGDIQFFLKPDAFNESTREVDYVMNKYSEYLTEDKGVLSFYVMLP